MSGDEEEIGFSDGFGTAVNLRVLQKTVGAGLPGAESSTESISPSDSSKADAAAPTKKMPKASDKVDERIHEAILKGTLGSVSDPGLDITCSVIHKLEIMQVRCNAV